MSSAPVSEDSGDIREARSRFPATANVSYFNTAAVSLAWLLAKPQVSSVIFGARTVAQLEANLAGGELELAPRHLEILDQASAFELGYPYTFIQSTQTSW